MTKVLDVMRGHGSLLGKPEKGVDVFTLNPAPGESFYSCRLTLYEAQQDSGAQIQVQPAPGAQGPQDISVEWWHDGGTEVRYQLEGFSGPVQGPLASSPSQQMTEFLPSKNGFHFNNTFPHVPDITLTTPLGDLAFGDAANGLCGGMVFAALDYFTARRAIPARTTPPIRNALFNYLVRRLLDSFNLPLGVTSYIGMMNPAYPDGDSPFGRYGAMLHGRAWRTIREEWPAIKSMLDAGRPCPLGLVRVKSSDLHQLGQNHQVLAIGYDVRNDWLSLYVYDPNYHDLDGVVITLSLATPDQPTQMAYSTGEPLYAFFQVNYKFHAPPSS